MYDIFNFNHRKVLRNLAAAGTLPIPPPPQTLPLPPDLPRPEMVLPELGWQGPWKEPGASISRDMAFDGHEMLQPWEAPRGPKPFGILHTKWSNVEQKEKYKTLPHHYTRRPTPFNTKPRNMIDRADDGSNTTVVLACIPDGLTADQCVDSLDRAGFLAQYNYLKFLVGALAHLQRSDVWSHVQDSNCCDVVKEGEVGKMIFWFSKHFRPS